MENKMTQQEQDELRELQKKLFDSRITLGDIEVRMSRLQTQKKSTLFEVENIATSLTQYQSGLDEKYGNKKVDLTTGELT
jgi:hypothetical protein